MLFTGTKKRDVPYNILCPPTKGTLYLHTEPGERVDLNKSRAIVIEKQQNSTNFNDLLKDREQ